MKIKIKKFIALFIPKDTQIKVDIEPGNLFMWAGERRPAILITTDPPNMPKRIHNGYFVACPRPRRWWYLWSWIPVAKALWRMPFDNRQDIK